MKTITLITTASLLLLTGCSTTNSALTPATKSLFDSEEWQPANSEKVMKEIQ